jgi:hypothetical protein
MSARVVVVARLVSIYPNWPLGSPLVVGLADSLRNGAQYGLARYKTSPSSPMYRDSVGLGKRSEMVLGSGGIGTSATGAGESLGGEVSTVHWAIEASVDPVWDLGTTGLAMEGASVAFLEPLFLHLRLNFVRKERDKSRILLAPSEVQRMIVCGKHNQPRIKMKKESFQSGLMNQKLGFAATYQRPRRVIRPKHAIWAREKLWSQIHPLLS